MPADWSKIIFPRFVPKPIKVRDYDDIVAFDTETRNGSPFLLASSDGSYLFSDSIDEYLSFLTNRKYRKTLNVFYNLQYDALALIKMLPIGNIEELYYLGKTTYNNYFLKYIPSKMLSIRKNKDTYAFYDIWQYYRRSLNTAAKMYFNEEKDEIDVSKFKSKKYIRQNKEKILHYCLQDTFLTRKLAIRLYRLFKQANIPFYKPLSSAYLAQIYTLQNVELQKVKRTKYNYYAWKSYYGGRFEIFQRGYFPQLYIFDIHSAYPSEIANLLDLSKGQWIYSREYLNNADYGFLKVHIRVPQTIIEPLPFRKQNLVVYPSGVFEEKYITIQEYRYLIQNTESDIKFLDGYFFFTDEYEYPFRFVRSLYRRRQKYKKENNEIQYVYKLIMNSIYGKFLQLSPRWKEAQTETEILQAVDVFGPNFSGSYIKLNAAGKMFNPVYASIITANTRLKLLKHVKNIKEDVVGFFTDSILTTNKNVKTSDVLGGFGFETKGEAVVIGSGVYSVRDGEKIKTRLRGFHTTSSMSLFDLLEKHRGKKVIDFEQTHVVKLGEALAHTKTLSIQDINKFMQVPKQLNINFDSKRTWERDFQNCNDALRHAIKSTSLQLSI